MFLMTHLGGVGWGGAHKITAMLANFLAENGYDVSIAVSQKSRIDFEINKNIKLFYLDELFKRPKFRPFYFLKKLATFRKLCKSQKIDYVVGFISSVAIYSILACVFSKRKVLVSERTDPHFEPSKKVLRGLRNLVFCFADKIVFQTPGARDYYPKIVRKKSSIIPNPISDSLPEPYFGERQKKIVNFCRIAPQKNLKVLLEAFDIFSKTHQDFILEIYGDGKEGSDYVESVKNYAKSLSSCDKICFYPACSDVHEKIKDATAFASSSDYEGISNSMLEALAIGLPVIVTDCQNGGERMCIENGKSGIIVQRQNPEELAEGLAKIADDKEFSELISKNAIEIREKFSKDKIFDLWAKTFENL